MRSPPQALQLCYVESINTQLKGQRGQKSIQAGAWNLQEVGLSASEKLWEVSRAGKGLGQGPSILNPRAGRGLLSLYFQPGEQLTYLSKVPLLGSSRAEIQI